MTFDILQKFICSWALLTNVTKLITPQSSHIFFVDLKYKNKSLSDVLISYILLL